MDHSPSDVSNEPHTTNDGRQDAVKESDYATLGGVIRKICLPIRPRVMAYLLGLLLTVIVGFHEVRRVVASEAEFPELGPDSRIDSFRQIPQVDPDGTRWVVYAQNAWEGGSLRIQHWTNEDGAPEGRYVGWSSPPMWWLESLAYVRHVASGQEMKAAIAEVSPHYNTFLWIFAAATMGLMCMNAYGWRGAFIIPLMFSTLAMTKYGSFSPDHHLWILLSCLGMLVCLSAPFARMDTSNHRLWFIGAALFCALGFWISAPSQALVLIGIFLGFLFVPSESVRRVDSANWRLFGEIAAVLSLVLYWFEYRPGIPVEIEINNPIYAAGVLVAGIWFWQMHDFTASGRRWSSLNARPLVYGTLFLGIVLLPVVVYLPYCYSLADPFHARWVEQIAEDQPIDLVPFITSDYCYLFAALLAAIVGVAIKWNRSEGAFHSSIAFIAGLALTYGYFGISSNRFTEVVLLCVAVFVCMSLPRHKRDVAGWFVVAFALMVFLTTVHRCENYAFAAKTRGVPAQLGATLNVRVASNNLLKIAKGVSGGILAPSNEANLINYYTKMPVYGTAYWENKEGLVYTYRLFFYEMPEGMENWGVVRATLAQGNVRYIVIPKDFGYDSSYMIYDQQRLVDPSHCFAYYLIHTDAKKFVPWLKLEKDDEKFRIFSVHTENIILTNEEKGKRG